MIHLKASIAPIVHTHKHITGLCHMREPHTDIEGIQHRYGELGRHMEADSKRVLGRDGMKWGVHEPLVSSQLYQLL